MVHTLDDIFDGPNPQDECSLEEDVVQLGNQMTSLTLLDNGNTLAVGVVGGDVYVWHFGGRHGAYEVCDGCLEEMQYYSPTWSSSEDDSEEDAEEDDD